MGIVLKAFNGYGYKASPRLLMPDERNKGPDPELMSLDAYRFVLVEEGDKSKAKTITSLQLKILTDPSAVGRDLYEAGQRRITLQCMIFNPTNHAPVLPLSEEAVGRRVSLIPFTTHFVKSQEKVKSAKDVVTTAEDLERIATLENNSLVLFCVLIEMAHHLYTEGGSWLNIVPHTPPERFAARRKQWEDACDPISQWVEQVEKDPESKGHSSETLFDWYTAWHEETHSSDPLSKHTFVRRIKQSLTETMPDMVKYSGRRGTYYKVKIRGQEQEEEPESPLKKFRFDTQP
jgi:phage/plasmid-associated DNA primase